MKKLIALSALTFASTLLAADVAYSPPVGGMTVKILGGTPTIPVTTSFTLPLLDSPAATGAMVGQVTSVDTNTITVSSAGWASGGLAITGFPYAIRITSGAGEGATFSITGNTAENLTVTGRSPLQAGVVAGDSFRIIPVDTLNTLFGSNTLLGGTSAENADIVTLSSAVPTPYYYNTSLQRWVRTTGPTTDRGNTAIPLDSVISVTRKAGNIDLVFVGSVPMARYNLAVLNSGSTYTHTGFPQDVTLGNLGIQARVAGWVTSSDPAVADTLYVAAGGAWTAYFHNGNNWQRTTGPTTNRDSVVISAGTPVRLFKRGVLSGTTTFIRNRPY